jgi:transcriptional regulator with XRE-family HTH domain
VAFPENLRRLRTDRYLTQARLAKNAGISRVTVTRLESGATPPLASTVLALAAALDVKPWELATPDELAVKNAA